MRVLMPLLWSLTWMRIYRRKVLIAQRPMIMIVYGYILARYSSMTKPDNMELVPTSLCENPSLYSPKESVPALSEFVVLCEVIVFFFNAPPRPCSLVCHVLFLSMSPVG